MNLQNRKGEEVVGGAGRKFNYITIWKKLKMDQVKRNVDTVCSKSERWDFGKIDKKSPKRV